MSCAICQTRRPKRFCPGVRGDICTICCGTEREVTVACPLDCEFLRDARLHEKPVSLDEGGLPNADIRITEEFLEKQAPLLAFLVRTLAEAALEIPGVVDFDLRDALEALIRTYRTLRSGVYYESLPENALARDLFRSIQRGLEEFRKEQQQNRGVFTIRDADILGTLAFLQRMELAKNNGRRRGRAFIDLLGSLSAEREADLAELGRSRLVLP
jgi:hypothetical protein